MAQEYPKHNQFLRMALEKGDDSVQCGIFADHSMVFCSPVVSDISGQKTKSHLNTHIFYLHQHAYIITPPAQLFWRKKIQLWTVASSSKSVQTTKKVTGKARQGKPLQTTRVCWNLTFFIGISSHKLFVSQRWTTFLRFKPVQTRVF